MDHPPSYEEIAAEPGHSLDDSKSWGSKVPQRLSIRDEVGASRSQHVAALVSKLLPQVRERAKQGLSKSTMILLPSNQDSGRKGQLVGFPEDELPLLIQLEGHPDTLEFWTQQEALDLLRTQMLGAVSDGTPTRPPVEVSLPPQEPIAPAKSSFFGRKSTKAPLPKPALGPKPQPSATVEVQLDEVYFRSETDYGLYETARSRCVLVTVVVR